MSFLGELFFNIKDTIFKRSIYLFFIGFITVGTYFFGYNNGENAAKYNCLAKSHMASIKMQQEMNDFTKKLEEKYQGKINEVHRHDSANNNIFNKLQF
jgi:hypothetical protein